MAGGAGDVCFGVHALRASRAHAAPRAHHLRSRKTTVIEALALLFGRDLVRELTEHDFFGSASHHGSRITIVATLTGFEAGDPTAHREWFGVERGVAKWRKPDDLRS